MKIELTCPTCSRAVSRASAHDPESAFPFCSRRCKLVDLGAWLDGAYRIPGERLLDDGGEGGLQLTGNDGGEA